MNQFGLFFKENPKYKKFNCSNCGQEIERVNGSSKRKYVCFDCKTIKAKARSKKQIKK